MCSYFLKTPRLGFRKWAADDDDLALAVWGDPVVMRLNGGPLAGPLVKLRLAQEIANMAAHGIQYWPIFSLDTHEHVGCCGLQPRGSNAAIPELGYYLRPNHWRQGYALEAARIVAAYAFSELGARALFAGHHEENESSRRVLLALGFKYTHHEFYAPAGMEEPCYILDNEAFVAGERARRGAPPPGSKP